MEQYKVEKIRVRVSIVMTDGAVIDGAIFLSPQSAVSHGRQSVLEILADETAFMPVTEDVGGFALIGKRAIAALYADLTADPTPDFSRRARALIKVEGAGDLDGELIVPEGPASFRVSDYLNGEEEWFRVETGVGGARVALVSRKAIKEIRLK